MRSVFRGSVLQAGRNLEDPLEPDAYALPRTGEYRTLRHQVAKDQAEFSRLAPGASVPGAVFDFFDLGGLEHRLFLDTRRLMDGSLDIVGDVLLCLVEL